MHSTIAPWQQGSAAFTTHQILPTISLQEMAAGEIPGMSNTILAAPRLNFTASDHQSSTQNQSGF